MQAACTFSAPIADKNQIERYLDQIERPTGEAIYSEIFGSLYLAIDEFRNTRGRKAIIILSDGVNNPSYPHTQKINPQFGERTVSPQKPLEALQLEGIPLYVIHFGKKEDRKDRNLLKIAIESGGVTFDAHNREELKQVYLTIMDQILKEYVISYTASMTPADRKHLRVKYVNDGPPKATTRFYLTSTVFGQPPEKTNFLSLIAFAIAGLLLWWLSRLKFEKPSRRPTLEILNTGSAQVSTRILPLANAQTVIGSAPDSNLTIAGIPAIEANHATVVFDQPQNRYTMISQSRIKINNQPVQTKVLESGDLIDLGGVRLIFDDGQSG